MSRSTCWLKNKLSILRHLLRSRPSLEIGKKNLEHAQHNTKGNKLTGVASKITLIPRSLVDRATATIDSSDSAGETAFMTMRVGKQTSSSTNKYRTMTAENNATVLGDHCVKKAQGSAGSKQGITMLNSIRIVDPNPELGRPQSPMTRTMDPLACYS